MSRTADHRSVRVPASCAVAQSSVLRLAVAGEDRPMTAIASSGRRRRLAQSRGEGRPTITLSAAAPRPAEPSR